MRTVIPALAMALVACSRPNVAPPPPPVSPQPSAPSGFVDMLRDANARASAGDVAGANRLYLGVVDAAGAPREALVAAATGLYRTSDFSDALRAFATLGTFARGEEDLRYYNAVSLYETGRYAEAKKELACALPFIRITDEVARYREKIEARR